MRRRELPKKFLNRLVRRRTFENFKAREQSRPSRQEIASRLHGVERLKILKLVNNRAQVVKKLQAACAKLGEPGAASRVAKKILESACAASNI